MVLAVVPSPSPSGASGSEEAGAAKFRSTGGGTTGAGQVYMGTPPKPFDRSAYGITYTPPTSGPIVLTKQKAYDFFNDFTGKQLADLQAKMLYSGLIQENDGIIEMQTKWKKLVDVSAGLTASGKKITPFDVLDSYLGKGPLGGKKGLGGVGGAASVWQVQYRGGRKFLVNTQTGQVQYQGPKFETTYSRSINLTDPSTAKAIATSIFQQLLHRDPGNGELGGFSDALRSAEQASPSVTNTTTEYDPNTGEPIGQSSTTSGGLDAAGKQYLAEQRVKKSKEYGSVQAATTYENALESAIFNNPFGSI